MTFIRTIERERAQGGLSELYDAIAGARGGVARVLEGMSLNPEALAAQFELYKVLLFGRSELDRRTREMIGVVVSAANDCAYGVAHHTEPLRTYGVESHLLDLLGAGQIPDDALSPAVVALLTYAQALTREPKPDAAAVDQLRELGWSDGAILDATMVCAYFNFLNRITQGLGVELEGRFEETCAPEIVEG